MELTHDRRAQSVVVGSVVLFGFLILALSLYQVQIVPQQNAETEFNHFEQVQNEFIVLRNAVSRAGQNNLAQYESIRLGTTYEPRVFTINPPPAVGTLRTSDPYNITVGEETVQSRFLEYRNGYNEYPAGSLWYDNSVVYLETEEGRRVIYEDQNLVTGDGQVRVTALQNAFRESGVGRQTVELFPVENASVDPNTVTGEIDIELPTRLNGSYWDSEIPPSLRTDPTTAVNESAYPGYNDVYRLELTLNASDLRFNTVGIDSAPQDAGKSLQKNIGSGSGAGGDGGSSGGGGGSDGGGGSGDGGGGNTGSVAQNITITQSQINNGDIILSFRNDNPSAVTFTQARLDSYSEETTPSGNRAPIDRVIYQSSFDSELVEGESLETVGGPSISNGGNQDVTLSPQRVRTNNGAIQEADAQSGDTFMITIEFDDGSTKTYDVTL
jgi:uncharacterized membrane protein YgcG